MTAGRIPTHTAASLIAAGVLLLGGVIIHPHAPNAQDMTQVAYTQTGQFAWWPAHVLLLSSYVAFATVIISISRIAGSPFEVRRVLGFARPVALFCILAMLVHLLLPLGRDSVANSQHGWAFWAKDVAESVDCLWAVCIAVVAWTLGRTGIMGNRLTALFGMVGGLGFGVFSILVPLTGVAVSMQFTRSVLHVVPAFVILITAWAVVAGVIGLGRPSGVLVEDRA